MAAQQVDTLEPYQIKVVRELPTGKQSAKESRDSLKQSFKISYRLTLWPPSANRPPLAKRYQIVIPDCMGSTAGTCGVFHVIQKGPGWFYNNIGPGCALYQYDMTFEGIESKTNPSPGHQFKLSLFDSKGGDLSIASKDNQCPLNSQKGRNN